jgi:hypothetical protein
VGVHGELIDTLSLLPDSTFVHSAALRGERASVRGRWWIFENDVVLDSPLHVEPYVDSASVPLTQMHAIKNLPMDFFRFDKSLGSDELGPRYRRVR